jgi:alkaline phosphatase D
MKSIITLVMAILIHATIFAQSEYGYPRLMQGPMVGAVESEKALIWVRASGPFSVSIRYTVSGDTNAIPAQSRAQTAAKENDYCVTIPLENLLPDTRYDYWIEIDGAADKYKGGKPPYYFKTGPGKEQRTTFRVAYGSCARFQKDTIQPIWQALPGWEPDLFFWLGDNIYGDALDSDILAEEYARQREVATLAPILSRLPQLATWDDHDFGLNNHDRTHPAKEDSLRVWRDYWPNPAHGVEGVPGVFFKYSYGGVDFFFLDGRYHRSPNADPDGPEKTMLGKEQLNWLKSGLLESTAPFKVIVSGGVWTKGKGPDGDAWSSFLYERNNLFDWIRDQKVEGVVLLSGDTHTAELNVIPWSEKGGYDLYDLTASPLAQEPGSGWLFRDVEQRVRLPYDRGPNFGLLEFDMSVSDPVLRFQIINAESRPVWPIFELRASELRNGKKTWPDKQSSAAKRWMRLVRRGLK